MLLSTFIGSAFIASAIALQVEDKSSYEYQPYSYRRDYHEYDDYGPYHDSDTHHDLDEDIFSEDDYKYGRRWTDGSETSGYSSDDYIEYKVLEADLKK